MLDKKKSADDLIKCSSSSSRKHDLTVHAHCLLGDKLVLYYRANLKRNYVSFPILFDSSRKLSVRRQVAIVLYSQFEEKLPFFFNSFKKIFFQQYSPT